MTAVALYSGGIGSWAAVRRWIETRGSRPILLFTDTLIEDEDLYRFLEDSAADLDIPVTRIADGRSPWEVFHDVRLIGNTRADPCSKILKRDLARAWIDERSDQIDTVILGIDWTEIHRLDRARPHWEPYTVEAPLTEEPYIDKPQMIQWARSRGLEPPRLYEMGFPHNNCGGFCVKQGQGAFIKLLKAMPERYAEHEAEEEAMREYLDKDVAILRDRTDGDTRPLTLRQLRERHESEPEQLDLLDLGGCNCMV